MKTLFKLFLLATLCIHATLPASKRPHDAAFDDENADYNSWLTDITFLNFDGSNCDIFSPSDDQITYSANTSPAVEEPGNTPGSISGPTSPTSQENNNQSHGFDGLDNLDNDESYDIINPDDFQPFEENNTEFVRSSMPDLSAQFQHQHVPELNIPDMPINQNSHIKLEDQPSIATTTIPNSHLLEPISSKNYEDIEPTIVDGKRLFMCTYPGCSRGFTKPVNLRTHVRTHTGEKPFKCNYPGCNKAFAITSNLNNHIRTHTGERPFKCNYPDCNKAFKNQGHLIRHAVTHGGEKSFRCHYNGCNKAYTTQKKLNMHIREKHASAADIPQQQNDTITTYSAPTSGVSTENNLQPVFFDDYLHDESYTLMGIYDFLVQQDTDANTIQSSIPDLSSQFYGTPYNQESSTRQDDQSTLRSLSTTTLNTKDNSDLTDYHDDNYIKPTNSDGKRFKCDQPGCERVFKTKRTLTVHSRSHTGDKPYKCTYAGCNKAFVDKTYLTKHEISHTGEKPFKCTQPDCTKAYNRKGDLKVHMRIHTGEKPFKCTYELCNRSFTTRGALNVHIRVHTGERPYKCTGPLCDKAFIDISGLKKHIRTKHPEQNEV